MISTIVQINKEVAQELGFDQALVKQVNAFYWKNIHKEIASGEHTSIRLRGIGTLTVSRTKLNLKIKKLIERLRSYQNSTKTFNKEEAIRIKLNELSLLCKRRNEIAILYREKEIKLKKRKNEILLKGTQASLGEQAPDSSGTGE